MDKVEIINCHFSDLCAQVMFQIRINVRCRLWTGSSLGRAAAVLSLLILCLIPRGQVFSQQSREKEREQRILQIQQLFGQGDLAGSRKLLDDAAKKFPADAGLDNLLGIIEAQEGNYAAAERSFNRAVARERKFTGAYLNLGRLYQEHAANDPKALPKALEVYRRVLRYEPDNAEANYQSAALRMRKGAYQASLDHLSRLPAKIQNSAQALSVSCADYAGLGRSERANEMAGRLLAHPDFSELDVSAILPALTSSRRDDLSVALLEGLRKRQPLSPALARHLGLAYEQTGKLAEARATLETSVGGDRPSAALLVDLARVAHKQQDYQGALGYLAHARDLEPNNAGLSYFFGLVCLDLNLVAEARKAFDGAVKLEPENPAYNYAMGATSAFRHDPSEAIPYFEKYARLKPRDARGKLALGAALFRAKRYDAAAEALTEATKFPDIATTARYYLGSIARQEGRLDEAVQELQQALKANPDYTDALAELGQCYLMKKEYEPAGKLLRRALEINPNHYAANFNLLTLYARAKDGREAAQAARFEEVKKLREEMAQEFLRMVEVRPYPIP
jgi:tetratricopeptide (TPR) repeat protein